MNNKMRSAVLMKRFEKVLQCPLCAADMKVAGFKSLACVNHHTFDLAKQGYVNVAANTKAGKYDQELFEARKMIADSGFFEPLYKVLTSRLKQALPLRQKPIGILDAGCGEGSHLIRITEDLKAEIGGRVFGAGIDLSKAGILTAARRDAELIWFVADLANAPFQRRSFHVILNILSPSNYAEFKRLISADGMVIKVMPKAGYLQELREAFYAGSEKSVYSNHDTAGRFLAQFALIDRIELSYSCVLNREELSRLLRMTPLSWRVKDDRIADFLNRNQAASITVDLDVLIGVKKAE
ncbi:MULTISPECIES: putative RNA methyltransferase [unclassified Bacillus (in: firmicutes)]|uniref:putative RNA methyltransferase n=1 Tax=unclassified Bacillus (in: firmicutes) TaxID=185979 RepID=UPI000418C1A0|nr:methyltransferase domain-containing protein [Bacillus sp. NSP9.1]QHZ46719.1 methyltransferase domain-containing protein [Bacillus sp. NSP9.1]